jgi:hypothetical protein
MIDLDARALIDPEVYARSGPPHAAWARLRREAPVTRFASTGDGPLDYGPFWAITRYADIHEISRRPELFSNAGGILFLSHEQRAAQAGFPTFETVIEMDPPRHRRFRKVASAHFTPNAMERLGGIVEESARSLVDELAGASGEGECDSVTQVAVRHPLRVLSTMLGVPREDEPRILRLTAAIFGNDDPEFLAQENRSAAMQQLGLELYQYFSAIVEDRRAHPRDDLASVLANGLVDGQPMGPIETFGYYLIAFTAGHETTRNALAGGMLALIEHPEQLEKLRANPALVGSAVEEIVRWTTPVNYMKRTVKQDVELQGEKLREGDELLLFYGSANRDEQVFADPFTFRIDRAPNPHLSFGVGEHFCLGAHLARRSSRAMFQQLVRRIEWIERVGEPERLRSNLMVGVKHLPIRYRIARA